MSQGISRLQFSVILPLGATMLLTLLLLSRVMRTVFERYHAIASHVLLGFVMATTLMMLLKDCILSTLTPVNVLIYLLCILCGAGAGFGFTYLCDSLRKKAEKE
jgi:putative membrane protein